MLISIEDLEKVLKNNGIFVNEVVHIGGHHGQEAEVYHTMDVDRVLFLEPMKESFKICKEKAESLGYECENWGVGEEKGKMVMYTETANKGQSSSMLEPKKHLEMYPGIQFDGREEVDVITLDGAMEDLDMSPDMIVIDVQGYEKQALSGGPNALKSAKVIFSEVNEIEMYSGGASVSELDEFLSAYGFSREMTSWVGYESKNCWGDAIYIKKENNHG
jgi:FkbM family methyltransferase